MKTMFGGSRAPSPLATRASGVTAVAANACRRVRRKARVTTSVYSSASSGRKRPGQGPPAAAAAVRERDGYRHLLFVPHHDEGESVLGAVGAEYAGDFTRGRDLGVVDFDDHVAGFDAGFVGDGVLDDGLDQHAVVDAEKVGQLSMRPERFAFDPEKRRLPGHFKAWYFDRRQGRNRHVYRPVGCFDDRIFPGPDCHRQGLVGTAAPNDHLDLPAGRCFAHQADELFRAFHHLSVVLQYDITLLHSGFGGGAVLFDVVDLDAAILIEVERPGALGSDLDGPYAQIAGARTLNRARIRAAGVLRSRGC